MWACCFLKFLSISDLMAFHAVRRGIPIYADYLAIYLSLFLVTFRTLCLAMHNTQRESGPVVIETGDVPCRRNVTVHAILLRTPRVAELTAVRIFFMMAAGTLSRCSGKRRRNSGACADCRPGWLVTLYATDRLRSPVQV